MKRILNFAMLCVVTMMVFGTLSTVSAAGQPETMSLVVKLVSGLTSVEQAAVVNRNGGVETSSIPALRLHVITVQTVDYPLTLQNYQSDPQVESVEANKTRKAEGVPGDPNYGVQWALSKIGWESVFGTVTPSGSAKIAILDTGIDALHPDLNGNIIPGTSILNGTNGLSDTNGHGTSLAGIVASLTDNGEGIAGIGYAGVHIMPVTVLGANGLGQDSDIIAGIIWAADQGADVILMGFSNPDFSQNLQDAIDYAWLKGAVMVAATGNDGVSTPTFPAGDRSVIGVSATDQYDALDAGSNYGQDVFLAAPGANIYTTTLGNSYTYISGTSASSAIVAGVAAFMKAVDPSLTNGIIVGRLGRSADYAGTLDDPNNQTMFGNGRVNIARALADTSTDSVQPAGTALTGSGGPFIGPYTAASKKFNLIFAGTGGGTISFSGFDHQTPPSCTGTCYKILLDNHDQGTLTVTPETGSVFSGWSGSFNSPGWTSCSGTTTSCIIDIDKSSQTLTATFLQSPSSVATITLSGLSQTYNGTPKAVTVTTSPANLTGVSVTYDGSATVPTNAGSYAVVASLTNVNYQTVTATGTLVINKAEASVVLDSLNVTYDGTPKLATASTTPAGKTVTLAYDGSASAPTAAGSYTVVATVSDSNYQGSAIGVLTIGKQILTVIATGVDKQYDGSNAASVTLSDDRKAGDELTVAYASAIFINKNAGTGKLVTVSGVSLSGAAAGNYQLSAAAAATASISVRSITVTAATNSKTFDGAVTASATPAITSGNLAAGDTANFMEFYDNAYVGTSKTLTPSGSVIDGNGGGNYRVTFVANTSGTITIAPVMPGITANSKTYDGTTTATIATRSLSGVLGSDDVSLTGGTATFADAGTGIAKTVTATGFSLVGTMAGNYQLSSLSATTTADITDIAPVFTSTSPASDSYRNTAVVGYILSKDVINGSGTITFTQTGGSVDPFSPRTYNLTAPDMTAGSHSINTGLGLENGAIYSVSFNISDGAGYSADPVVNTNVLYDASAATITLVDPVAGSSVNNATVNYTLSKNVVSGTIAYTRTAGSVDGGSPHTHILSGADLTAGLHTVTTNPALVEGTVYSVSLTNVIDLEGNTSAVVSNESITFDTTSVTITGTLPSAGSAVKTAAVSFTLSEQAASGKITFTRTGGTVDSDSPRVYTLSGSDLTAGPHNVDTGLVLVDGAIYTVSFDVRDAAGNAATTVSNASVIIDRTAPQDGTLSAVSGVAQIELTWSGFTDAASAIGSYTLVVDSTLPASCSAGTPLYSGSTTTYLHTGLSNGTPYFYRLCATDTAGNVSAGATANAALQTTPTISWANPADIPSGTSLSGTQLNAIASVPGSFVYNPATGTVLIAGNNQTLSVNFIPNDTTNYSNVSATVKINVIQPTPCGAPTYLNVPATNTTGTVSVAWGMSDVSGVTYILERSYNGGAYSQVYSGSTTSVNLVVTANGSYTYRVKAIKTNYADSGYTTGAINTCSVTLICGAPTYLNVPATNTTGTVSVAWGMSDVSGVTYILERSYNGGAYSQVYSGSTTSVNLVVTANGSYTYRVKAIRTNYADSGYTTGTINTCSVTLTCGAPTYLNVPATNTTGTVSVAWGTSDVSGVTYILERSYNGGAYSQVYSGSATSVNLVVTANGSYTYRVKAIRTNYADSGYTTGAINTCSVTLTCGAPTRLDVPATNTTGTVSVSWGTSDVSGVTYILERSYNGGAYSQVYSGSATSVNLVVTANGSYTYRVKAIRTNYADSGYTTGATNTCSVTLTCGVPTRLDVPATNTTGTVSVSWGTSDVSGVTYILEGSYNGGAYSQVYSGSATSVNLVVTANGSYTYRVKAIRTNYADSGYTTGATNTCSVTLTCGAPTRLDVPATNTTGTVSVSWGTSDVSGVTYILERSYNGGAYSPVYSGSATSVNLVVTASGSYTYRVKAIRTNYADSGYTTGATNTCSVTLTCGAPTRLDVPATNTTGTVSVSWGTSDVSGVTYILEGSYNGGAYSPVYSGSATSVNLVVTASGSYTYRVKAIRTNYADSGYTTGTTNTCSVTLICGAPTYLNVPATNTTGTVSVAWGKSDVSGVTYILEGSYNGGAYSPVYSGSATSVNLVVTASGSYTYRVKAIRANYADSGYTTGTINTCSVTLICGAPTYLNVPATNTTGTVSVAWGKSDVSGVTYILEGSYNGGVYSQVYSGSATSVNLVVTASGSYTYRVKAIRTNYADSGYTTGAINTCSVTLICGAPTYLNVPATNTTGTVSVAWGTSDVSGVTYILEGSYNGGAYSQVYSGPNNSNTMSGLANGTYSFRVKAFKMNYADSSYRTSTVSCTVTK